MRILNIIRLNARHLNAKFVAATRMICLRRIYNRLTLIYIRLYLGLDLKALTHWN